MNKIVNGVANDYEFPNLYDPNISYSKAYTEQLSVEKDKEIEKLKNELSIKTTYIEDLLKIILKSDDFKMQREVYRHGIEYDKKLKELKEKNK